MAHAYAGNGSGDGRYQSLREYSTSRVYGGDHWSRNTPSGCRINTSTGSYASGSSGCLVLPASSQVDLERRLDSALCASQFPSPFDGTSVWSYAEPSLTTTYSDSPCGDHQMAQFHRLQDSSGTSTSFSGGCPAEGGSGSSSLARVAHWTQRTIDWNADREAASQHDGLTTLLVTHSPMLITLSMLTYELNQRGFHGFYDFVYLPHGRMKSNRTFAFINFTSTGALSRFVDCFQGVHLMMSESVRSPIALRIGTARVQGFENNVRNYAQKCVQYGDAGHVLMMRRPPADVQAMLDAWRRTRAAEGCTPYVYPIGGWSREASRPPAYNGSCHPGVGHQREHDSDSCSCPVERTVGAENEMVLFHM